MTVRGVAIGLAWFVGISAAVAMAWLTSDPLISEGPNPFSFAVAVVGGITVTVGWLLVDRRPGNRIGLFLAIGGTLLTIAFGSFGLGALRWLSHGQDDVVGGLAVVVGQSTVVLALYLTFPAATLLFPDGRLPGPRWRWPVRIVSGLVVLGTVLTAVSPWPPSDGLPDHPFPLPVPSTASEAATTIAATGLIIGLLLAAGAVLARYARSSGAERAQMKWLLAALAVSAVLFPLSWTNNLGPDDGLVLDVASVVALGLVPIAILVAVLRYHLYDIDRLVSRSVSWAIISGLLIGVFVSLVIGLQAVLSGVTQGSTVAVAASTLVAATMFMPLRRRVQTAVDRRFDRGRYDADRLSAMFAERVRGRMDLDAVSGELLATATRATHPSRAGIWLSADRGKG